MALMRYCTLYDMVLVFMATLAAIQGLEHTWAGSEDLGAFLEVFVFTRVLESELAHIAFGPERGPSYRKDWFFMYHLGRLGLFKVEVTMVPLGELMYVKKFTQL